MDETCTCGDVADEHEQTAMGPSNCLVDGCPCICFEADEGADR